MCIMIRCPAGTMEHTRFTGVLMSVSVSVVFISRDRGDRLSFMPLLMVLQPSRGRKEKADKSVCDTRFRGDGMFV